MNAGSLRKAGSDYLQVSFANYRLGGSALDTGSAQEQILFMVCPECIAGMLFLPPMNNNESIEIISVETYSQSSGYGSGFRFAGDHTDTTPRDSWGRRQTCVGAIDALCCPGESQFKDGFMIRELNKAYCGFSKHSALCGYVEPLDLGSYKTVDHAGPSTHLPAAQASRDSLYVFDEVRLDADGDEDTVSLMEIDADKSHNRSNEAESSGSNTCVFHQKLMGIATGNWGAGAYRGNLQLKSLLQWISASQAGCATLLYYSFGDPRSQGLREVVDWIKK